MSGGGARSRESLRPRAPVALILHSHPQAGGTMNNKIVYDLFYIFQKRNFTTLRFNFRGVGKSQGVFDNGVGELSDAASALDWVQQIHPEAEQTWVAGVSFGAWIGMQLLMRRPEITGFVSVAPPRPGTTPDDVVAHDHLDPDRGGEEGLAAVAAAAVPVDSADTAATSAVKSARGRGKKTTATAKTSKSVKTPKEASSDEPDTIFGEDAGGF